MNVVVTWWERNQTSNEPVLKISSDFGRHSGLCFEMCAQYESKEVYCVIIIFKNEFASTRENM
jgi:hypothetical protein